MVNKPNNSFHPTGTEIPLGVINMVGRYIDLRDVLNHYNPRQALLNVMTKESSLLPEETRRNAVNMLNIR